MRYRERPEKNSETNLKYNNLLALQFWNPGTYIQGQSQEFQAVDARPLYGAQLHSAHGTVHRGVHSAQQSWPRFFFR